MNRYISSLFLALLLISAPNAQPSAWSGGTGGTGTQDALREINIGNAPENPLYRREFIDSLKNTFRVQQCCASTIARCMEQKPECGIAPRLNAFIDWMGYRWWNEHNLNERVMAEWLQNHYISLSNTRKYAIDTEGWPIIGDSDAPITIVLYYSMSCPFSRSSLREMVPIITTGRLKGKANIVVKPLGDIPGNRAMVAADIMGRFKDFMVEITRLNEQIDHNVIYDVADAMLYDRVFFARMTQNQRVTERIAQSTAEATGFGVNRIPTYFIAGRRYTSLTAPPRWLTETVEYIYETEAQKK